MINTPHRWSLPVILGSAVLLPAGTGLFLIVRPAARATATPPTPNPSINPREMAASRGSRARHYGRARSRGSWGRPARHLRAAPTTSSGRRPGNGGWMGYFPLGGLLTSSPAVASWAPNRLDVWGYHLHVLALQRRPQPVPRVTRATMAWKRSGVRDP